jgi:hypothetical protein
VKKLNMMLILAIAFENRALVSKKGKGFLQISVLESRQQWYEITSKHLMAIIYATAWVPQ